MAVADAIVYTYFLELCLQENNDNDLLNAEPHLKEALNNYPQNLDINILAAKYYRAKKYLICKSNDAKNKISSLEDQIVVNQNDCQRRAATHYKKVRKLFLADPGLSEDVDVLAQIAELHLLFEATDDAEEVYRAAIKIKTDHVPSIVGKGVIANLRGNYKDSIALFKSALLLDPDDLSIKSNLAEVYLRNGNYSDAEKNYKEILALTAGNQDAIIGLGELFKTLGDQAKEKNNKTDLQDYYELAQKWFTRSIQLQTAQDNAAGASSKRLSPNDLGSIYYSLGYINCALYEATSTAVKQDRSDLNTARTWFKKIYVGTDSYSYGQSAIKKIDRALDKYSFLTTKAGAGWIIGLAIAAFILAQIGYFFVGGKPKKEFYIPAQGLKELMVRSKTDSLFPAVIQLTDSPFNSVLTAEKALQTRLEKEGSTDIPDISKIILPLDSDATGFRQLGEGTYISMTFGCLIFIIVGFFIGQISKLKLGGFELEKTVIDQVNTITPNLNISQANSAAKT